MTNTKNTAGQITTFGNGADLNGLDDGTDKIHSGILKALFAAATGNYLHSISTNGVTQSEVGGFTRFTTDNPMTFYRNGERYQITGSDLTVDYSATHDSDSSTDRFDFLVINASNTLSIRKGTVVGSDTNVPALSDGDVPICLIKCVAASARTVITRPLQFYTAADSDRAIFMTASSGDGIIENVTVDKDILFKGIDSAGTITALTLDMSEEGKALFNAGADFKKDVTIYEDANDADVSLSLGTSATESLTISVLNGSSNKTAEEIHFSTATASGTANHGKMVFDVDGTDIATIDDGGIDLAAGKTFSINGTDLTGGTITALNNQTADRLVTIGATTTELDGEANLTFNGSTNVLAVTGSMTASTTITATTSVTSAAIVGNTSVTGATTIGTAYVKTGGQLYQTPEHLDNSTAPIMSGAFSVVYVSDISGMPANNNVELPDPNTVGQAVYTIRNIGVNPITITIQGGLPYDGNTTHHALVTVATRIDLPIGQHVTVQAIVDSGTAGLQTGYYIIGN